MECMQVHADAKMDGGTNDMASMTGLNDLPPVAILVGTGVVAALLVDLDTVLEFVVDKWVEDKLVTFNVESTMELGAELKRH